MGEAESEAGREGESEMKSYSTLARIAAEVISENPPKGTIDGAIAICQYIRDNCGIDLTIREGAIVDDFAEIIAADRRANR